MHELSKGMGEDPGFFVVVNKDQTNGLTGAGQIEVE